MLGRAATAIFVLLALLAATRDDGVARAAEQQVTFVPWKVLNPGDEPARGDLVLFWLPASRDEMRHSPLLTSRPLSLYAGQCIGMQVIRPDDVVMIERLGETGKLPAAVLTTSAGTVLDRIENEHGSLIHGDVERMTRDALQKLETETNQMLDDAAARAAAGDRDAASQLYGKVLKRRCLFPRKAREAERALRRIAP